MISNTQLNRSLTYCCHPNYEEILSRINVYCHKKYKSSQKHSFSSSSAVRMYTKLTYQNNPLFFCYRSFGTMRLTSAQVVQVKIITSFILNVIRKKPLFGKELSHIVYCASTVNLKLAQPIIHTLFPNLNIPNYELVSTVSLMPSILNVSDLISLQYATNVFLKSPFFKSTKFTLLEAPLVSNPKTVNPIAYMQTGQKYPDYLVYFKDKDTLKYFDLKSGQYKPFSGHLILANTPEAYERISKELFLKHLEFWKIQPKEFFMFFIRLSAIYRDNTMSWGARNSAMQDVYSKYLYLLPKDKSPTLLFQVVPDYAVENTSPSNLPITQDIFLSEEHTEKTIINCILQASISTQKHYSQMPAVSPTIKAIVLENLQDLLKETTTITS